MASLLFVCILRTHHTKKCAVACEVGPSLSFIKFFQRHRYESFDWCMKETTFNIHSYQRAQTKSRLMLCTWKMLKLLLRVICFWPNRSKIEVRRIAINSSKCEYRQVPEQVQPWLLPVGTNNTDEFSCLSVAVTTFHAKFLEWNYRTMKKLIWKWMLTTQSWSLSKYSEIGQCCSTSPGDSFTEGNGTDRWYGANFILKEVFVLFTVNYRLGLLLGE